MSGPTCSDLHLNSKEDSKKIVQNKSVDEAKKKEKKNFCYVCQVQCTAAKNFKEHKNGRKHLRNVRVAEREEKQKSLTKNKNVQRNNICSIQISENPKKSQTLKIQNSKESEMNTFKDSHYDYQNIDFHSDPHNTDHYSGPHNTDWHPDHHQRHVETCNTDSMKTRSGRYFNSNQNYQNRNYANNSGYLNANSRNPNYKNQPLYLYPPVSSYSNNSAPYPNAYVLNYADYTNHSSIQNNFLPSSFHLVQGSSIISGKEPFNLQPGNSLKLPLLPLPAAYDQVDLVAGSLSCQTSNVNKNSKGPELNVDISNVSDNLKSKDDGVCSPSPSTYQTPSCSTHSVHQSTPVSCSVDVVSPALCPNSSEKNFVVKRIRSRSSESRTSAEKKTKDASQNQSIDSNGTAEQQKIKDWTNNLLETSHGQISRLIHPSNYKDKAAVSHLITNLSKSKRKENLTRLKLRSNSLGSNETNEEDENDVILEKVDKIVDSVTLVSDDVASSVSCLNELKFAQSSFDVEQNIALTPTVKKVKRNSVPNQINCSPSSDHKRFLLSLADEVCEGSSKTSEKRKEKKSSMRKSTEKIDKDTMCSTKTIKKRKQGTALNQNKKQKSADFEFEKTNESENITEHILKHSLSTIEDSINVSGVTKVSNTDSVSDAVCVLKNEVTESLDENNTGISAASGSQNTQAQSLDLNGEFSVETLIQLFATGDVKVKKEFNDPVIDAIKTVDPAELIACSNKSFYNKGNKTLNKVADSAAERSKSTPVPEPCISNVTEGKRSSISPVRFPSAVTDSIASNASVPSNSASPNPVSQCPSGNENSSVIDRNTPDNYLSCVDHLDLIPKDKSELTPHLKMLIKDLQKIASQEEMVKQNLQEAKNKITEYQTHLEEWKNKKKRLQGDEEDLRKKRNDIIELMQNAVKPTNETSNKNDTDLEKESTSGKRVHSSSETNKCYVLPPVSTAQDEKSTSSPQEKNLYPTKNVQPLHSPESDEIAILPSPVKTEKSIIIIDIDDADDIEYVSSSAGNHGGLYEKMLTNIVSSNVSSVYDLKTLTAHGTVINCVLVFEDFLYTCSNDSTAKRFSLKDPSQSVQYLHSSKNVTEIVVEKVQNEAMVCTSCSNRVISLFIASNGTRIKYFFQTYAIMSICKGWGKFYCGLADGSINVYNSKYEEREVVKSDQPASRIATTHQGRLHFLIILTSSGNISVRDAETGLLIRYIKGYVKLPSWLTVHNSFAYLTSSDKSVSIIDINSGRAEKKMYLTSNATGLAVYEDYIFTIAYSGYVSCYSKEKVSDKKIYYGAGKSGLTCVHVYQDWVFTGNRKGDVSVFKFDPYCSVVCQFGNCCCTFGLKEDLEFHMEKDHLSKKRSLHKCQWGICSFLFPPNWDIQDKMRHMKRHIQQNIISCVA